MLPGEEDVSPRAVQVSRKRLDTHTAIDIVDQLVAGCLIRRTRGGRLRYGLHRKVPHIGDIVGLAMPGPFLLHITNVPIQGVNGRIHILSADVGEVLVGPLCFGRSGLVRLGLGDGLGLFASQWHGRCMEDARTVVLSVATAIDVAFGIPRTGRPARLYSV
jgi:hypothetical protein